MANVFGILTTILLLAGAFIAYKNKEALENEIGVTKDRMDELKTNQGFQSDLIVEIARWEKEASELTSAETETAKELATQLEENAAVQAKINTAETQAAAKEKEVADAQEQLKEVGDLENLVRNLEATNLAIASLTEQVATNEAMVSQLENTQTSTDARLTILKEANRVRRTREVPLDLDARVRSVYRNWGFVTIGAGDNDNVMKDSILQVTRDGRQIARIKVTGVEANTAAANIIADSVAEGESISSGDRVSALPSATTPPPATPPTTPEVTPVLPADPATPGEPPLEDPGTTEPPLPDPGTTEPPLPDPGLGAPPLDEPSAFGESEPEPVLPAEDPAAPDAGEMPDPF